MSKIKDNLSEEQAYNHRELISLVDNIFTDIDGTRHMIHNDEDNKNYILAEVEDDYEEDDGTVVERTKLKKIYL